MHPNRLNTIEIAVHLLGEGLHFRIQLLLNREEGFLVLLRDEVHSQTQVTETAGTTDTVKIRLTGLREIEVDHHIHGLHVHTASK